MASNHALLPTLVPAPATLVEALRAAATSSRGVTMVDDQDHEERRTWAEILAAAERRAAGLCELGIKPGDPVIIVLDSSFEYLEVLFGCMLAGAVPTPAYPPTAMARLGGYVTLLAQIAAASRAKVLVTSRRIYGAIASVRREAGLRHLIDVADLSAPACPLPGAQPDDLALIQCTSGSTAAPKPVALRHRNLLANIQGMRDHYAVTDDDVIVSWLPLYHDLGLIGQLLASVIGKHDLVLLSPATFLLDPAAWWRAASRHKATLTAAPCFAFGLSSRRMSDEEIAQLDLSSLRVVASGAEPIQPATIDEFYARFAPAGLSALSFCAAYGLAESCVGVTSVPAGRGLRADTIDRAALEDSRQPRAVPSDAVDAITVVALGQPYPGGRVVIRGRDGAALGEREVGEVVVSGPSVMSGYLHNPEATAAVLRDGELRTGDIGYLAAGELYLVGRAKHMLIVRGKNYYAEAIEGVVELVPGVRRGNAVAFGVFDAARGFDRLWIVCETREKGPARHAALKEQIAQAVAGEIGLRPAEVVLLRPNTIPKTSSGKKQRHECRALLTARPGATSRRRPLSGLVAWLAAQIAVAEARLLRAGT